MSLCECGCGQPAPIASITRTSRGHIKGQPVRYIMGHSRRGKTMPASARAAIAASNLGKRHSEQTIEALRVMRQGSGNPMFGRTGESHPQWKGDRAGYEALHRWVRRHKPKTGACSCCGSVTSYTEWANISGQYLRDLNDYDELCRPCHRTRDGNREASRARKWALA